MSNRVYKLTEHTFVEGFEDGALVLRMNNRNIFELNLTAYQILENTDGVRTDTEVAIVIADIYKIPEIETFNDVRDLYNRMKAQKIVEIVT